MTPDDLLREGYVSVGQEGTFASHVQGLLWRRTQCGTDTLLRLEPHHLNPNGVAHGGVLLVMLDITLGATAEGYTGAATEQHNTTVQLSCAMMASSPRGAVLRGEAAVDHVTRTLTFVSGRLHCEGRTVVTGSAVFRNPAEPGADTR